MIKKFLCYFIPILIFEKKSILSHNIEIAWNNGALVMDSKNTNYSYGSLQRILRKGLQYIGFHNIQSMKEILILGVAGGSVVKTLVNEIKFEGRITGVEIDKNIIEIANQYFKLNEIPNFEIVIEDAFEFILKNQKCYDLIIIDIFQDTLMPTFLFEDYFSKKIIQSLDSKGFVLFNTMCLTEKDNQRNIDYVAQLDTKTVKTTHIARVEQHNELILIQKIE